MHLHRFSTGPYLNGPKILEPTVRKYWTDREHTDNFAYSGGRNVKAVVEEQFVQSYDFYPFRSVNVLSAFNLSLLHYHV